VTRPIAFRKSESTLSSYAILKAISEVAAEQPFVTD